ncbi:GNAT family N-acetyltransferase [Ottowia beijingensis]|uniref:GNAT family N-acetyltransferase n=1 Tax=Ottowia beijingensis TaxID=1207057 RepID=UPI00214DB73E|nr:GNAT family N-acetyltransferase [Ottowia beijingensis]
MRVQWVDDPRRIDADSWNALLATQATPTPFIRHAYLAALHDSGSAVPGTGWAPRFLLLWDGAELAAACPLYVKAHSYGEYVFDWAWANAYAEHGLRYYPKALVAVPFTPVPGSRLLARDAATRAALVRALVDWCEAQGLSSLHVLYGDAADHAACEAAGLMQRQQVQFHWKNRHPAEARPFTSFDDFLASLSQDKRKKIRQERRKVAEAGVRFHWARGADIAPADWAFFYRCYERTYLEHGNAPYLTPAFFDAMARDMADAWVLFIAEREGAPIASSLIAVGADSAGAGGAMGADFRGFRRSYKDGAAPGRVGAAEAANEQHEAPATGAGTPPPAPPALAAAPAAPIAYGRYWGALERVDCLHFEACYYQPIDWCIRHGVARFEGGAQGEHKMARALMPVPTASHHWLAHPAFADAVGRFLAREAEGIDGYMEHLENRSPFRR